MCDTITVNARMRTPPGASRKSSNISCGGGGRRVRPASGSCSQRSIRSSGLPVVPCMRDPPRTNHIHPRPDCCRIPCCKPPLPKCPLGLYVERVQPIRPDRQYEPPTIPFDSLSSYREHYHLKCSDRAKSFKPQSTFDPSDAKMDGLSSYREAYTCKPLLGYQKPPWSKKAQFEPSGAKMEGASTYRLDYTGCMGDRVQSLKPLSTFDPSTAKMDGVTTYRTNYIPYCSREYNYAKQPPYKKQIVPGFSCAPMEGMSTYRSDFWPKCPAKRQSLKPNNKARFSDAKFADRTTYRNDYTPFHFEKCVGQCIPSEVYDEMFPDCGAFACGLDEEPAGAKENFMDCCPGGGPPRQPGSCGNEMGLFPGCPLPECCQLDPVPKDGGDC